VNRPRIAGSVIATLGVAVIAVAVVTGLGANGGHARGAQSRHTAPASGLGRLVRPADPGPLGSEVVPVPAATPIAPASAPAPGQTVDGISTAPSEQLVFHIHAHLTIFVAGTPRQIPYGIGIRPPLEVQSTPRGPFAAGGAGFSWLHTHAADGIIHIESPVERTYTLGEFFDVWRVPLGSNRVGAATGPVTAFVDGRQYLGSPRDIPLAAHAQIQLDVGRPLVAPESIAFPPGF
jgi:hypothetical protein